jgi:hypothetical protein
LVDNTLDLKDEIEMAEAMSNNETPSGVSPDLVAQIKAQVLEEMKNDAKRKEAEDEIRREKERKEHDEYVKRMKESPDPWVEIVGWKETKQGVKIELDWNDPFIEDLKKQGVTGADEDQIVQKWIIFLMQDMASKMEDENTPMTEYQ